MKRIVLSLMLLGFMVTLVACGGDASDPAVPEDNVAEEAPIETTPDAKDSSEDPAEPAEEPAEPAEEPTEPDDELDDESDVPTDSESGESTDDGYTDPDISGDDGASSEEDGYTDAPDGPGRVNAEGELELTLEELSYYDGTDGKKAYVAVDGIIYDMTDSSHWSGGSHYSGNRAGRDLSEEIRRSPHGLSNLQRVPTVGILVESEAE